MGLEHRPAAQFGERGLPRRQQAGRCVEPGNALAETEREAGFADAAARDVAIDLFGLGDQCEAAIGVRDRLRSAEEQYPRLAQGEVEQRDYLRLRVRGQVDQQIAAGDEADPGKGRVGQNVLHREHDVAAQGWNDAVSVIILDEIAGQPIG